MRFSWPWNFLLQAGLEAASIACFLADQIFPGSATVKNFLKTQVRQEMFMSCLRRTFIARAFSHETLTQSEAVLFSASEQLPHKAEAERLHFFAAIQESK